AGLSGHAAVLMVAGQFEHAMVEAVEAGESDELEFVAHRPELTLEAGDGVGIELCRPVEAWRAIVGEQLAGIFLLDLLGEPLRLAEVRVAGLPPEQIGMRGEGEAAPDAMIEPRAVAQPEEALGRPLAGQEVAVAGIDVSRD